MADVYYFNESDEYLYKDDEYIYGEPEDCCCDEECDCETDGPTADFSYTQTDNDPCTFDFTDESVAGDCGAIVSWEWKCGGNIFSTAQNPTGIDLESECGTVNPWDITLTVTDSFGCMDEVVGEVSCMGGACRGCTVDLPDFVTVIVSGVTDDSCDSCDELNGTHVLWFRDFDVSFCEYIKDLGTICDDFTPPLNQKQIRAQIVINYDPAGPTPADDYLRVTLAWSGVGLSNFNAEYLKAWNPFPADCYGTHTLALQTANSTEFCDPPASVTLII